MSQELSNSHLGADKLELHHRQQLSALVDGELAPDQARFLLRRLQHDRELAGCYERWQLCGQVLRGQFQGAAAPDFGMRVAEAIRAEAAATPAAHTGSRSAWARWGGGVAALAASVAAVALLVNHPQAPVPDAPAVASSVLEADLVPADAAPAVVEAPVEPAVVEPAAQAPVQLAVVEKTPRARRPAERPQAVVRESLPMTEVMSASRIADAGVDDADRSDMYPGAEAAQVASAATAVADSHESFATVPLDARPWPRTTLPPQQASGAYTASFGGESTAARTFYPFEPQMPANSSEDASSSTHIPDWDASPDWGGPR